MPRLLQFDHLVLTVADLDATIDFYSRVLSMTPEEFTAADGSHRKALLFGSQKINLHQAGAEFEPKAKTPVPGSADLCFLSEDSLESWQDHLKEQGILIEIGPVPRTGATGPLKSIYIRDPDGNLIELSERA